MSASKTISNPDPARSDLSCGGVKFHLLHGFIITVGMRDCVLGP